MQDNHVFTSSGSAKNWFSIFNAQVTDAVDFHFFFSTISLEGCAGWRGGVTTTRSFIITRLRVLPEGSGFILRQLGEERLRLELFL